MGRYSKYGLGYQVEDTESPADRIRRFRKEEVSGYYNSAVKTLMYIPSMTNSMFSMMDTANETDLNKFNIQGKIVNQDGTQKQMFTNRAGYRGDSIIDTLFTNKIKNSTRGLPQRIKIRKNVLRDDFVNYWADNMMNHPIEEVKNSFIDFIGKDTVLSRAERGDFSMKNVIEFYESDHYTELVANPDILYMKSGGDGMVPWMEDIASFSHGDKKGLKAYVSQLAEKMDLSEEDLHYILTRDGGYKVLPNADASQIDKTAAIYDDKYIGPLQGDDMVNMDPTEWADWNATTNNLIMQDGLSNVTVGDDGVVSIPDEYFGSEEFFNLPDEFKKTLKNANSAGMKVDDWVESLDATNYDDLYGGGWSESVEPFNTKWGDDFGSYVQTMPDIDDQFTGDYKDKIVRADLIKSAEQEHISVYGDSNDFNEDYYKGLNQWDLEKELSTTYGSNNLQKTVKSTTTPAVNSSNVPLDNSISPVMSDIKPIDTTGLELPTIGDPNAAIDTYKLGVESAWKAKPWYGKVGTGISVLSAGATLVDEDSDEIEQSLAVGTLAAEGAAIGAMGTTAASLSWIPYVGPALTLASLAYSSVKGGKEKSEARTVASEDAQDTRREEDIEESQRRMRNRWA